MNVVLLDTTVASLLHPKKKGSPIREFYDQHMRGRVLALSFQSVAELWSWAERSNWGAANRRGLDAFVRRFLIVPYDYELAKAWARVSTGCARQGRRLEAGDAWIAATAIYRQVPLLAHDRDFVGLRVPGLEVVSLLDLAGAEG